MGSPWRNWLQDHASQTLVPPLHKCALQDGSHFRGSCPGEEDPAGLTRMHRRAAICHSWDSQLGKVHIALWNKLTLGILFWEPYVGRS